MKFHIGKWVIAGIVFGIISWLVNGIIGWMSAGLYTSSIWRPMQEGGFFMTTFFANIVGGLLFALMYTFLYKGVPCKSPAGRGALFGFIAFVGVSLYGIFMSYMFIEMSLLITLLWVLGAMVSSIIGGLALGVIYNPKDR